MYYVYVLKSVIKNQIYTGSTKDLKKRLNEHNDGKVTSTKRYNPWNLIYYEAFIEEKLARVREKNLKYNGNAMKELKKRIGLDLPSTTLTTNLNQLSEKTNKASKSLELKKSRSGAGFTLIEILIVVGLIAALTAAALFILNPALQLQKARDSSRKTDIKRIQQALEQYRSDNGTYPKFSVGYGHAGIGALMLNINNITYLNPVPTGPNTKGDSCKGYVYSGTATDYTVFVKLENVNDSDAVAAKDRPNSPVGTLGAGSKTFTISSGSCSGAANTFNYWVNNP
ncbi:MAG: GIY-YIG nuclease family protein [Patescibacteria group bacterium]